MTHVRVVKKAGRTTYAGRYKAPDGRWHQTAGHPTPDGALTAAREAEHEHEGAYVFREGDYFVGRYLTPAGWLETEDGFDDAQDALDEARELGRAARADAQPGA